MRTLTLTLILAVSFAQAALADTSPWGIPTESEIREHQSSSAKEAAKEVKNKAVVDIRQLQKINKTLPVPDSGEPASPKAGTKPSTPSPAPVAAVAPGEASAKPVPEKQQALGTSYPAPPAPPKRMDTPWVVNSQNGIYKWNHSNWEQMPGLAKDIGAGPDGSVWVIGVDPMPGGFGIYKWDGRTWTKNPEGGATRIDVDHRGMPWVVNNAGSIYRWNGRAWDELPGKASDIGIGPDGSVWVIGVDSMPGGFGIYRWNGGAWAKNPGGGAIRIDVDHQGMPWVLNNAGSIYRWNGRAWDELPGKARDIGLGISRALVIGINHVYGGFGIYEWKGNDWGNIPGGAVGVTVAGSGRPDSVLKSGSLKPASLARPDAGPDAGPDARPDAGPVNFGFETGTLEGWNKTGTAFDHQPTFGDNPTARHRGQPSKHRGNFWIGGFENRPTPASPAGSVQGDGPQGTLVSQPFVISDTSLEFLIGGGCDMGKVRVELLVDGKAVKKATGKCRETLSPVKWDVSAFQGRSAQVRIVDQSSGGWGHINFDGL
ncbi:MAG: hypothetical protein HUN04_12095 [Desulfobacter sp.]|nr:MAG: hypothetical protein HUN04_12095 [Desulfobacter sp.]